MNLEQQRYDYLKLLSYPTQEAARMIVVSIFGLDMYLSRASLSLTEGSAMTAIDLLREHIRDGNIQISRTDLRWKRYLEVAGQDGEILLRYLERFGSKYEAPTSSIDEILPLTEFHTMPLETPTGTPLVAA